ncbi:MAG: TPM domain-containing protein [Verrucomicrobiales bacterium]
MLPIVFAAGAAPQDQLPPKPAAYFNDYAQLVSSEVANRLNARLDQFERESSNQIVVAIFPKLPEGAALEDYTVRTAESWGAGQKKWDNGAVLFVFAQDRKLRIEVGYGLEGALPDGRCDAIIRNDIRPHFRAGNYAVGLEKGIDAIIAATRGEYQAAPNAAAKAWDVPFWLGIAFVLFWVMVIIRAHSKSAVYHKRRRLVRGGGAPIFWGGGGGSSWGGGGGGGFSGGGGSFGGGGASGDW